MTSDTGKAIRVQSTAAPQLSSNMWGSHAWDDEYVLRCFCDGDLQGIILLFRECLEIVNHTLVVGGEEMRWNCRNHGLCFINYFLLYCMLFVKDDELWRLPCWAPFLSILPGCNYNCLQSIFLESLTWNKYSKNFWCFFLIFSCSVWFFLFSDAEWLKTVLQ